MSKHSRHRPYKCTECQKRFAHKGQLKSHAATHAGNASINLNKELNLISTFLVKFAFLCNLCGHQFRLKQQFKSHMLAEHPNTPAEKKRGRPKKSDH